MTYRAVTKWVYAVAVVWLLALPTAQAAEKIGLVLMHGKLSNPQKPFQVLVPQLERGGILVETPEMPWSRQRGFDRSYDAALSEIDAAVQRLRARGATKVVIGGHSLGAAAALTYAAYRPTEALLLLALGHSPQTSVLQARFARSVARARQQLAAGRSDKQDEYDDFDASKKPPAYTIRTSAAIYLSYFDPDGFANTLNSATRLPAEMPVLWVTGTNESQGLKSYGEKLYAAIPSRAKRYVEVGAGHIDTPSAAGDDVLAWLRAL